MGRYGAEESHAAASSTDRRAEALGNPLALHDAVGRTDGGKRRRAAGEDPVGEIAHRGSIDRLDARNQFLDRHQAPEEEKLARDLAGACCRAFERHQEPGTEQEIKTFCTSLYGVKFQMFAKVAVNGPEANPLFKYLRAQQPGTFKKDAPGADKLYEHLEKSTPEVLGTDAVKWNFTKFLVDRRGHVVKRFEPYETPESMEPDVIKVLAEK